MRQIIQLYLTIITIFFTACSTQSLQKSSHKSDKKPNKGYLQKNLDEWFEKEWDPAVVEKEKDTQKRFKLQDYVDKASLYIKSQPCDENSSNVKRLEKLPVIGK